MPQINMVTGQMIHNVFLSASSTARPWSDLTPDARAAYSKMAAEMNSEIGLPQPCPFCAFYEIAPRPIGDGTIGEIPACETCVDALQRADITELLLEWLGDQV